MAVPDLFQFQRFDFGVPPSFSYFTLTETPAAPLVIETDSDSDLELTLEPLPMPTEPSPPTPEARKSKRSKFFRRFDSRTHPKVSLNSGPQFKILRRSQSGERPNFSSVGLPRSTLQKFD